MAPHNRRTVLKLVGVGVGGAATGVATGEGQGDPPPYSVVQGDRCVPVAPIDGSEPVETFYDWAATAEKRWSSNGTTHLQREDGSVAFLYDGPEGTSLVLVHGKLEGDGTGGSVSLSIYGLPADGEWVVRDDDYDGPDNYDSWVRADTASHVDWTWDGGRTDGGAFRGVSADDTIRVVPEFNEAAALYGEHYQGDLERWEFLSGGSGDPRRIELDTTEPLLIGGNECADDGGSDGGSGGTSGGTDGTDGGSGRGGREADDERDRGRRTEREKHRTKQETHERKREKHRRKQEKHGRTREKHRQKREKERRKHERKRRKHEADDRRERRKHRRKREKHEEKRREKHREKDDD